MWSYSGARCPHLSVRVQPKSNLSWIVISFHCINMTFSSSSHLLKSNYGLGREGHWDSLCGDWPPGWRLHAQESSEAQVPLWEKWQSKRLETGTVMSLTAGEYEDVADICFLTLRCSSLQCALAAAARCTSWPWTETASWTGERRAYSTVCPAGLGEWSTRPVILANACTQMSTLSRLFLSLWFSCTHSNDTRTQRNTVSKFIPAFTSYVTVCSKGPR